MAVALAAAQRTLARPLLPLALLAVVAAMDVLIHVVDPAPSGRGAVVLAALDEPAHLATAALILLNLRRPAAQFAAAALVMSVATDLDHVPSLLVSDFFTRDVPRPYTHSLLGALVLGLLAVAVSRRRAIGLGAAAGVLMHLVRDVATASGVALAWPLSDGVARVAYPLYFVPLALLAARAAWLIRERSSGRAPRGRRAAPPPAPGSGSI